MKILILNKNFKGEDNPLVSKELWNFTNHYSQQIGEKSFESDINSCSL